MSPSRNREIGPSVAASGVRWIADGTLPDAPDMRPSVTIATRRPFAISPDNAGMSLCSSGMPFARGPCPRTTAMKSHHGRQCS